RRRLRRRSVPPTHAARGYPAARRSATARLSRSYPLSHSCRQHSQLIAVLGHGAPRDLDAVLFEDVDDRLIGERMTRVLVRHDLLDLLLDAACRDVLARRG